jgi:hypothetical protein
LTRPAGEKGAQLFVWWPEKDADFDSFERVLAEPLGSNCEMEDEPLGYTLAKIAIIPIVSGSALFVFLRVPEAVIAAYFIWMVVRFFNGLSDPRHAEPPGHE